MVEQEAVNFEVASSSLAGGATLKFREAQKASFCWQTRTFGASLAGRSHPKTDHSRNIVVDLLFLFLVKETPEDKLNDRKYSHKNGGGQNVALDGIVKGISSNQIV